MTKLLYKQLLGTPFPTAWYDLGADQKPRSRDPWGMPDIKTYALNRFFLHILQK